MAAHTTNLNEIYQAIGSLTTEVKNLKDAFEKSERTAGDTANLASQSRAKIHKRVDELANEIADLKSDVHDVKIDVADTKLVTDEVTRWKLMGMGALGVTGIAAGAIGSAVTYWWDSIVVWARGG